MPTAVDVDRRRVRAHLGRCLRLARAYAGITSQGKVAEQLGVDRGTIGDWESGEREPMALDLLRLADLYGVSLDSLCGRTSLPTLAVTA